MAASLRVATFYGLTGNLNQITNKIQTGTIGELLVQIRLLQYGVQAAPPIKDSGNDLIAMNGEVFRAVSVAAGRAK